MRTYPALRGLLFGVWATLILAAPLTYAQTVAPVQTSPATTPHVTGDDGAEEASYPFVHRFDLQFQVANVYDSNIDHNDEDLESYGLVPGMRLRYRNRLTNPTLILGYVIARHQYTNTEKWDRISNKMFAAYEPPLEGDLRMTTEAEVSLRGSSEDRDISNQYQVMHEFEYRITSNNRVQVYGTARLKRFPDDPDDNAFKPNVGVQLDRRLPGSRRWELGVRYEINTERRNPRGNYQRWTFDTEYRIPFANERHELRFDVNYRRKYYENRYVEIEDEDWLRRDFRWNLGVEWQHTLLSRAMIAVGYKFEARDSNDPEKPFDAHMINLRLLYSTR